MSLVKARPLTYVDAAGRPLPDRLAAARRALEVSIARRAGRRAPVNPRLRPS